MINWAELSLVEFAGFVSKELCKKGLDTVLVDSACPIYSEHCYQFYDVDMVYENVGKLKEAYL